MCQSMQFGHLFRELFKLGVLLSSKRPPAELGIELEGEIFSLFRRYVLGWTSYLGLDLDRGRLPSGSRWIYFVLRHCWPSTWMRGGYQWLDSRSFLVLGSKILGVVPVAENDKENGVISDWVEISSISFA